MEKEKFLQSENKQEIIAKIKEYLLDPIKISTYYDNANRRNLFFKINEIKAKHDELSNRLSIYQNAIAVLMDQIDNLQFEKERLLWELDLLDEDDSEEYTEQNNELSRKQILTKLDLLDRFLERRIKKLEKYEKLYIETKRELENLDDPMELLWQYHQKVRYIPLNEKDKEKYLSLDFLTYLDLREYFALWGRLNLDYVSLSYEDYKKANVKSLEIDINTVLVNKVNNAIFLVLPKDIFDLEAKSKEKLLLNIDSTIVYIPVDLYVHKDTGKEYLEDENANLILNTEKEIKDLWQLANDLLKQANDFEDFYKLLQKNQFYYLDNRKLKIIAELFYKYSNDKDFLYQKFENLDFIKYKKDVNNLVKAQNFYLKYYKDNPDLKPKHLYFYNNVNGRDYTELFTALLMQDIYMKDK